MGEVIVTGWDEYRTVRNLPADWALIRANVFRRDGWQCVRCGAWATDVDHIGNRDDHSLGNLRALCSACHRARTARQGGRAAAAGLKRTKQKLLRAVEIHPGLLTDGEGDG